MFDLIKTFILGIWIEKKYRYLFLFILFTLFYRFLMWIISISTYEMAPVDFIKINNNGSLTFIYNKRYEQVIYPNGFQIPTKSGHRNKTYDIKNVKNTKQCERDFFTLYKKALNDLLNSSADGKYILRFKTKFPKNTGEITYFDKDNIEKPIFDTLYKQGFIFNKTDNIDYCEKLKIILNNKIKQ